MLGIRCSRNDLEGMRQLFSFLTSVINWTYWSDVVMILTSFTTLRSLLSVFWQSLFDSSIHVSTQRSRKFCTRLWESWKALGEADVLFFKFYPFFLCSIARFLWFKWKKSQGLTWLNHRKCSSDIVDNVEHLIFVDIQEQSLSISNRSAAV